MSDTWYGLETTNKFYSSIILKGIKNFKIQPFEILKLSICAYLFEADYEYVIFLRIDY